ASTMDSAYGATSTKTGLVSDTGYTSFGELGAYTLRTNGNMVGIGRSYDTDTRRLTQILTTRQTAPTNVADVRYGYDPAGNVTRIADQNSGDTQCFRTDHLARLTEAWTPASGDCAADPATAALGGPASYWQSYTYDVVGNRTKLVEHGTPGGDRTTTYTVPGGRHQMTTLSTVDSTGTRTVGYGYDQAGNLQT